MLAMGSYHVLAGLSQRGQTLQQIFVARFEIHAEDSRGFFPTPAGAGWLLNSMQIEIHAKHEST